MLKCWLFIMCIDVWYSVRITFKHMSGHWWCKVWLTGLQENCAVDWDERWPNNGAESPGFICLHKYLHGTQPACHTCDWLVQRTAALQGVWGRGGACNTAASGLMSVSQQKGNKFGKGLRLMFPFQISVSLFSGDRKSKKPHCFLLEMLKMIMNGAFTSAC